MKKLSIALVLALSFFAAMPYTSHAALSADDFMPITQAPETEKEAVAEIKNPAEVKEVSGIDGQATIEASTAQDAINSASQKMISVGAGCQQIKFPSGFGWVATGVEVYEYMENYTATLNVQRLAYQKAFLQAKKNLTEALFGLSTSGKEQLNSEMKSIATETESVANMSETTSESIREDVIGLIKGFVVYSVNDEQKDKHGTVTVTIVTTPKTQGAFGRPDISSLSADSIKDGLNHILAEINNGLMPPVGGKTITVAQTGELAFVAYGSAIVIPNENPAVQAKMAINAQKIATMRARSSLCGIILGEDIMATSSFDEQTKFIMNQFEEINAEDPTNITDVSYKKLQEQKSSFLQTQVSQEEIKSLRSGILPAGVNVHTYFNEDKTMAEAVAVYLPSMSQAATAAGKAMENCCKNC